MRSPLCFRANDPRPDRDRRGRDVSYSTKVTIRLSLRSNLSAYRYWYILFVLEQTNRIRAVFGAGFAVLLGVGMAAVVQTFVWENSVTLVARTYETLNRIDGI